MADAVTLIAAKEIWLPGQSRALPVGQAFSVPADLAAELQANGSATLPPAEG